MSEPRRVIAWLGSTLAVALAAATAITRADAAPAAHDASFWQAIVDTDYRLPEGESARAGLGSPPGDSTLRRSFSLLDLSVLAAYDLKAPFMSPAAFEDTLQVAIDSLAREQDLRGFEPGRGWVHATAHAADLLKFLARNPKLTRNAELKVVHAVRDRLRSAQQVFVWGEDARLAAALLSILRRPDADAGVLQPWLAALREAHGDLWSGELDPAAYAAVRAQVNTLTQLAAMLGREPDGRLAAWESEIQATLAQTAL